MKHFSLVILLSIFTFTSAFATHIVGGEIELSVVKGQINVTHKLNLNLYFDDINGQIGAVDQTLNVGIFRKKDNLLIGYATLPLVSNNLISYTNPACLQSNAVRTRLLQYSVLINLLPDDFSDDQGYYIAWERCCRNNIISNIQNPAGAASVFYLAFPAQKQNGTLFLNSSPSFKMLTGDYICLNRPFTFEFGATDSDGDSLAYSLVTPYNGFSTATNPKPDLPRGSSNYSVIEWGSGYNIRSVMSGSVPG
mgnify:CR=1 FL=1